MPTSAFRALSFTPTSRVVLSFSHLSFSIRSASLASRNTSLLSFEPCSISSRIIRVARAECTRDTITGIICDDWTMLIMSLETRMLRRLRVVGTDAGGGNGSGNLKSFPPLSVVDDDTLATSSRREERIDHSLLRLTPAVRRSFTAALINF